MDPKKHLVLAAGLALTSAAFAGGGGTASLQIIHNCADAAASTVDIWVNGALFVDNVDFRTATPFTEVPAGVPLVVDIAPGTSVSASESIFQQTFTLAADGTYLLVASGIVSATGYSPAPPFTLAVYDMAQETAAGGASNTDLLVYHGSTDAPTVDVYESGILNSTAVDDISCGEFTGYLALPTDDYTLQVRDGANSTIVATYSAPLSTLGLGGAAITVLASGFLDPSVNSNGPAFGLYVALASGGALVPLPALANPTARLQIVHNSADLAAASVDVWLNNTLLLDNLEFRHASAFLDAQAGVPFVVSIAAPTSSDTVGAIAHYTFTLDEGGSYIVVANGIVSASGYSPVQPFDLYVASDARETANVAANTDILVFHGATDAPTVDVAEIAVLGGATLVNDLTYGSFSDYLEVPTANYVLEVRTSDGAPVAAFHAPLGTLGLQGQAITVFASGFLDSSVNSNGPAFGLWASLASGGPLVPLELSTGIRTNSVVAVEVLLYPNPAYGSATLELSGVQIDRTTVQVCDPTGRLVKDFGTQSLGDGVTKLQLDLSSIAPGSYSVLLNGKNASSTIPLQVVR